MDAILFYAKGSKNLRITVTEQTALFNDGDVQRMQSKERTAIC